MAVTMELAFELTVDTVVVDATGSIVTAVMWMVSSWSLPAGK